MRAGKDKAQRDSPPTPSDSLPAVCVLLNGILMHYTPSPLDIVVEEAVRVTRNSLKSKVALQAVFGLKLDDRYYS